MGDLNPPGIPCDQYAVEPRSTSYFTGWVRSLHGDKALVAITRFSDKRSGDLEVPFKEFSENPLPGDTFQLWTWFEDKKSRLHYKLKPRSLSPEETLEWRELLAPRSIT